MTDVTTLPNAGSGDLAAGYVYLWVPGTPPTQCKVAISDLVSLGISTAAWKEPVRAASTANVTLASGAENGDTIDGVVLVTGDRILLKNQTAPAENGVYCADLETEILSKSGWKRATELAAGEEVLTLNMGTGEAEWQQATAVHIFPSAKRAMHSFESRGFSAFVTPDHRWPIREPWDGRLNIRRSYDLKCNARFIRSAPCSSLPTVPTITDEIVELVAWFITEGHIRKNNSGSACRAVQIVQSPIVNAPYVASIQRCLNETFGPASLDGLKGKGTRTNPAWSERTTKSGCISFDLNGAAGDVLTAHAPDKIPSAGFINSLTQAQLELFLDTCINADGHTNALQGQRTFIQQSQPRIDAFQMAASLAGVGTTVHEASGGCQAVNFGRNQHAFLKRLPEQVEWEGEVWCPETPNGTWLARRNGGVYFTGNTVNASGSPSRASDAATGADLVGAAVLVEEGTSNADALFVCTTNAPITLGTTGLTWSQLGSLTAAAASDIWAGTSVTKAATAKALADSAAPQTLTDGATINWDMAAGYNAKVTLGGSRTLATPTNPKQGLTYSLAVIQDATGSRTMTWPSAFDWGSAGAPTLTTTASKRDRITVFCTDAATPKFDAFLSGKGFS